MPKLTILMAAYNGSKYIDEQIESILKQTYKNYKLIILDDNSTDHTYELLKEWASRDSRIEIQRNDFNLGTNGTYEKLLRMVKTKYFSLADQDDYWLPNKLADSIALLEQKKVDLVYTDLIVADERLRTISNSLWKYSNIQPVSGKSPLSIVFKNCVTGCSVVSRTSLLERALPLQKELFHDIWLAIVACTENGKGIAPLNKPTVLYRQHKGSLIGATPFSIRGFIIRVKRNAKGNFSDYLENRIKKRLILLKKIERFNFSNKETVFLQYYYRAPWFYRLINIMRYGKIIKQSATNLHLKNRIVDILLNLLMFRTIS